MKPGESTMYVRAGAGSERAVDTGAEWRSFVNETGTSGSNPSRASRVDEQLPSGGLGSHIPVASRAIHNDDNRGGGRLAQLHTHSRLSQADRQAASGYDSLVQLAYLLDLPQNIRVSILSVYIYMLHII